VSGGASLVSTRSVFRLLAQVSVLGGEDEGISSSSGGSVRGLGCACATCWRLERRSLGEVAVPVDGASTETDAQADAESDTLLSGLFCVETVAFVVTLFAGSVGGVAEEAVSVAFSAAVAAEEVYESGEDDEDEIGAGGWPTWNRDT